MKINKIKINTYGKLKEKEIELKDHINLVYGENEAGKSTLLNFITNSFYGISKNKKGKEISDFEKYTPWVGEDFSGKVEYELGTKEKFEVYRDFKKKNPKIYNEEKEDISKQFNIDKNKGNQFFYEQTNIDQDLFLSTVIVNQEEVKLEKQSQNLLIQKIANLVGTGEDNVSFKRAIDRIDRRKLSEIGTSRSREKPINLICKEIEELENEKQQLEKYENIKYEIEENKNSLAMQVNELEDEEQLLKEIKLTSEKEKIENEKINLQKNLKKENIEKIENIKNKAQEINSANNSILEEAKETKNKAKELNKKAAIIFIIIILFNILQFILIKNNYIKFALLATIPIAAIFYIIQKNKIKKQKQLQEEQAEKTKQQIKNYESEIEIIEKNNKEIEEQISQLVTNYNLKIENAKERIKAIYANRIPQERINELINESDVNLKIQNMQSKINSKKIELHTLELDYKNIEPKLESLANLEEKIAENTEKRQSLENLEKSMNLAKQILEESYEKMKNTVTPKFTEELSKTIAEITNNKYTNVRLNDQDGLIIELENGNYVQASRLSIGTIDQLYLSLRLSMVEELSKEKMPIILDEAFAYYDKERLENILAYLEKRFANHQIILFTCTNREKDILEELSIEYNEIKI